jgi:CubicO group peptidase (beta-lactamase class C family)
MSPAAPRPLPGQPNVRYLKLEAKRRLAAGEFATLHDAQLAVAREHGARSWSALRQLIGDRAQPDSPAVAALRWLTVRFRAAGQAGWNAPDDTEMRQHFTDEFLGLFKAGQLVGWITRRAGDLGEELRVITRAPFAARAEIAGLQVFATVEPEPPHRISGLRVVPGGRRRTDQRAAGPVPFRSAGVVPAWAAQAIESAFDELGAAGLVMGGGGVSTGAGSAPWVVTAGWADLDRREALHTGHRFPAPGLSALVTATAVLRLAAEGSVGIDAPANDYLRSVRLADDSITVRELLTHSSGVADPPAALSTIIADSVPDLVSLTGPVLSCDGPRGVLRPSNYGYAVLGQLVADVTAQSYAEAATRLVLAPLGMTRSAFPARTADLTPDAVTGYELTADGEFTRVASGIPALQAVGGLWAPPADLVRLAIGWTSLLPPSLTREALTPQTAASPEGYQAGAGWLLTRRGDVAVHAGSLPGAVASLLYRVRDTQVHLTLATRAIPVDLISRQVLRAWAAGGRPERP